MTISGVLPRRWRPSPEVLRHAEAIAAVLHTAPLKPSDGGPTVISLVGTIDVLPYLVAIKSFRRQVGRGRNAVIDDGTLTGEDRAILAHHCGDPEILPLQAIRFGPFPANKAWALLLTMLDRRAGRYWIALDAHTVTMGPLAEVEEAVASNRSFAGRGCVGISGFAAGSPGRALLAGLLDDGPDGHAPDAASATQFIQSNEPRRVDLPCAVYAQWRGKPLKDGAELIHFPARHRFTGTAYAEMSATAIDELAR